MKKALILVVCFAIAAIARLSDVGGLRENLGLVSASGDDVFASAFAEHRENFVAEGHGTVTRVLSDDNDGSRHQRFIVTLGSGQTLLISHNIDLAPRIDGLAVGDSVSFKGEYEWNDKGGVVHWTHHDPEGRHEAGWIRHGGKTYQ
jgi:hypothetical protein